MVVGALFFAAIRGPASGLRNSSARPVRPRRRGKTSVAGVPAASYVRWVFRMRRPLKIPFSLLLTLTVSVAGGVGCNVPGENEAVDTDGRTPFTSPEAQGEGVIRTNARDGLEYVWIEPGTFVMGCAAEDDECRDNEKPRRQVLLQNGFWMAQAEVTVEAFERFVSDSKYATTAERDGRGAVLKRTGWENAEGANWRSPGFGQNGRHPVVLVSWHDAEAFCEWSGGRLPTEEEWEYAARGGQEGAKYVWGDESLPIVDVRKHANVADRSASGVSTPSFESEYADGFAHTSPVGAFEPNGFRLHDMAGNVLEWCAGVSAQGHRMARGGAWNNPPELVRVSRRSRFAAEAVMNILGFRCVRDVAPMEIRDADSPGT